MWSSINVSIVSCTKDSDNETKRRYEILTLVQKLEYGGIQASLWLFTVLIKGK